MAPKKQKKSNQSRELSEEDMRRLGMSDEDIQRIISLRSKPLSEKKAEQEKDEAMRRQAEHRSRMQREIGKRVDELVSSEQELRVPILTEEEEAWEPLIAPLKVEKTRLLRQYYEQEAIRKQHLVKKKRIEELQQLHEEIEQYSLEERAAIAAEIRANENQKTLDALMLEEARKRKKERRAARIAARRERDSTNEDFFTDSDDDDAPQFISANAEMEDTVFEKAFLK